MGSADYPPRGTAFRSAFKRERRPTSLRKSTRTKPLKWAYNSCMQLPGPLCIIATTLCGSSLLLAPAFGLILSEATGRVGEHFKLWSLWLGISWLISGLVNFGVQYVPTLVLCILHLFLHTHSLTEFLSQISIYLKIAMSLAMSTMTLATIRLFYARLEPSINLAYMDYVQRFMTSMFGSVLVLLMEKIVLCAVSLSYKNRTMEARVKQNTDAMKALRKMEALRHAALPHPSTKAANTPKSVPAARVQFVNDDPLKHAFQPKQLLADAAQMSVKHKHQRPDKTSHQNRIPQTPRSKAEALVAERTHIYLEDVLRYFPSASDAKRSFRLFDTSAGRPVSQDDFINEVERIYTEYDNLSGALGDAATAAATLDRVLLTVSTTIIALIWFLVFNRMNTLSNLAPFATVILGCSFIFGNSARDVFNSLVFIFITHPFDAGDTVMIDDNTYVVKAFGLVSTTFDRVDRVKVVIPNSVLATSTLLHNLSRSGSMWESTSVQIAFDSPLQAIHTLRLQMRKYVTQRPIDWAGGLDINIDTLVNQNYIQLIVSMEHKNNFADWAGRWRRRTQLMRHLKSCMDDLGLNYKLPLQPVAFERMTSDRPAPRGRQGSHSGIPA